LGAIGQGTRVINSEIQKGKKKTREIGHAKEENNEGKESKRNSQIRQTRHKDLAGGGGSVGEKKGRRSKKRGSSESGLDNESYKTAAGAKKWVTRWKGKKKKD